MEAVRVEKVELHLLPFIPADLTKLHTQRNTQAIWRPEQMRALVMGKDSYDQSRMGDSWKATVPSTESARDEVTPELNTPLPLDPPFGSCPNHR